MVVIPQPDADSENTQVCVAVFPEVVVTGIPGVIDLSALERLSLAQPRKKQRVFTDV